MDGNIRTDCLDGKKSEQTKTAYAYMQKRAQAQHAKLQHMPFPKPIIGSKKK